MDSGERDQPVYVIGVAAAIVSSHPQTLRMYERSGLVQPQRTEGNQRLYSEHDIQRIRHIQSFTQMGVNLAGIEIIFRLLDRIEELERQVAREHDGQQRRRAEAAADALRAQLRGERGER